MAEAVLAVLSENVPLPLPKRRKVVTKKGRSKLIGSFPQPNTHDLYLMMSTTCDHDLCTPDPTTIMKLQKKKLIEKWNG